MILVDTSIWVDHLQRPHPILQGLLTRHQVLMHPFILGEIAMGHLQKRTVLLQTLLAFKSASLAHDDEVLSLIASHKLFGKGIGYIDAHLLASVKLRPDTEFWTRDKRLHAAAVSLSIAYKPLLN